MKKRNQSINGPWFRRFECLAAPSKRSFRRAVLIGGLVATKGDVLKLAALLGADVSDIQNERRRHNLLETWPGQTKAEMFRQNPKSHH